MMNEREMDEGLWQELHKKCKGSIYQSLSWANAMKAEGKKPLFTYIEEEGSIKAGIMAFEREIKTIIGNKRILHAEGTPLFLDDESGREVLKRFREVARNYSYGIISPNVINTQDKIFLETDYKKVSNNTILIDLSKTEEELRKSMEKKSARWGVNYAIKKGLIFEEVKSGFELEKLYDLYQKTADVGGFSIKSYLFLFELWDNKECAKVFVIKKEDEVVAGGVMLIDKDYTILSITASSDEGHNLQAMPFLYWKMIIFSKMLGKKYFDLGGYDAEAKVGEKLYNVNKFKENFGGKITEQPFYSTNYKYPLIRGLMKRFRILKKIYSKK